MLWIAYTQYTKHSAQNYHKHGNKPYLQKTGRDKNSNFTVTWSVKRNKQIKLTVQSGQPGSGSKDQFTKKTLVTADQ